MTFLNPAILFGLIAASIPIVLHFLNLRKLKKIEFSTLAFLKELQKTKIKRIKLKQWLLLLLRVLVIACLVLAFARPTVKSISFGSSSAKTTAVIIIDNTFSMSVVSGEGSYFNKAKQIAKSLINNFQNGDEIAVVPVAGNSETTIKPTSNFTFVTREIDELPISFISNTLNEAFIQASRILYESKNFNKEIYLLTDLQEGRIFNSENELSNLGNLLNDTRVFLVDLHDKDAANLGINEFKINNQIFEKGKTIRFSAEVTNYSNHLINNSVASLYINGKRSAQQSVSLAAGGTARLDFETTLNDTGLIQASVELEDDDINRDNKRYVSFYVPEKINLLILTGTRSDSKFVNLALSNPNNTLLINEADLSQLPSINLSKYNAVIIIGSGNNGIDKLANYVEGGNGIIIMPGTESTIQSLQNFFNNLGIPAPSSLVGKQNSPDVAVQFDKADLQNPIFTDLFEDKTKTKIESPDIYYYARITPGSAGRTIISMFDNTAFLSEYNRGSGKVLVFNSPPVLSCNNFPMKALFAPLMNKAVLYIASKTKAQQDIFAGQEIIANLSGTASKQIKIIRPDNSSEFINTDSLVNKKYLTYANTNLTGTYKFYSNNKLLDYNSVNFDPKESVTKYETSSQFEDYLKQIRYSGNFIPLEKGEDFSKAIYESRFGTELWKYFLIAALLLALFEMFISRSSKKDLKMSTD